MSNKTNFNQLIELCVLIMAIAAEVESAGSEQGKLTDLVETFDSYVGTHANADGQLDNGFKRDNLALGINIEVDLYITRTENEQNPV